MVSLLRRTINHYFFYTTEITKGRGFPYFRISIWYTNKGREIPLPVLLIFSVIGEWMVLK